MRKRTSICIAFACVLAIGTFVLLRQPQVAPIYEGRTTDEWELELAQWQIEPPWCGTGGYTRFVWKEPSRIDRLLGYFRIEVADPELPLVAGDPAALPALMELMRSPRATTRRIAIEGIRRTDDHGKIAIPLLTESLKDPDSDVGFEAANALRRWDRNVLLRFLNGK